MEDIRMERAWIQENLNKRDLDERNTAQTEQIICQNQSKEDRRIRNGKAVKTFAGKKKTE